MALVGTKLCRFYAAGQPCRYGSKCTHSHGPFDSGYGSQGSQAGPKNGSWFIHRTRFFFASIVAHCSTSADSTIHYLICPDRRHLMNLKKDQHLHHTIHRATFISLS